MKLVLELIITILRAGILMISADICHIYICINSGIYRMKRCHDLRAEHRTLDPEVTGSNPVVGRNLHIPQCCAFHLSHYIKKGYQKELTIHFFLTRLLFTLLKACPWLKYDKPFPPYTRNIQLCI